jgi:Uma2 family endonuclease
MALQIQHMTVEEFDVFAELPENRDKILEYIGGEVIEVPSNAFASETGSTILGELYVFLRGKDLGHLTGEAGGYMVSGERYAPDVAFVSKAKQPQLAKKGYNPIPPDLAVEVDFPSTYESQRDLRTKVVNYLAAGTQVWLVLPERKEVEVYVPGQPRKLLTLNDSLDGGDLLPGFTLALKTIFAE